MRAGKTTAHGPNPVCLIIFVNKVLLTHSHSHSLLYCLWLLSSYNSKVELWNGLQNLKYYTVLYRKSLQISNLNQTPPILQIRKPDPERVSCFFTNLYSSRLPALCSSCSIMLLLLISEATFPWTSTDWRQTPCVWILTCHLAIQRP